MVTVVDFAERKSAEGKEFFALIVNGGIEMVQSESGKHYATARKASVPSTFDEETCKQLIGSQIDGDVKRVEVEPYPFVIPDTGEEVILTHSYIFTPRGEA